MARTAKKKISILDEGIVLVEDVDSIDFAGAGVTGGAIGNDVTETIPGGGSGGVSFETPVGLIDSSNVTYTVSNTPKYVILNGSTYFENDGYTLAGLTITMLIVPETGSTLRSAY
jgi:hypothetical protein